MPSFYPISDAAISALSDVSIVPDPLVQLSGMPRVILNTKAVNVTRFDEFNFLSYLASGETILTATVAVSTYSGTDTSPNSLISGSTTISGAVVKQKFTGGVVGVIYAAMCTITTSLGQTLQLGAYLAVLD